MFVLYPYLSPLGSDPLTKEFPESRYLVRWIDSDFSRSERDAEITPYHRERIAFTGVDAKKLVKKVTENHWAWADSVEIIKEHNTYKLDESGSVIYAETYCSEEYVSSNKIKWSKNHKHFHCTMPPRSKK